MTWRTTLSVPLFSAALTITVPAVAQEDATSRDQSDRASQQQSASPDQRAAQPGDEARQRPTGEMGRASQAQGDPAQDPMQAEPQLKQASRILQMGVRNPQGQALGHISELVIEPRENDVKYAVLTTGETLGVGGAMHAVPWQAFSPGAGDQMLVLQVSQEQIGRMKGFDEDAWPDAGNFAFLGEVPAEAEPKPSSQQNQKTPQAGQAQQPGQADQSQQQADAQQQQQAQQNQRDRDMAGQGPEERTGLESEEAAHLAQQRLRTEALQEDTVITPLDRDNLWSHRASKLIGLTIQNAQGEDLGTVDDIIVETNRGKLAYAVVAYGGTLGIGDKRAIVPWSAMKLNKQEQVASLDADTRTLDQLAFEGEQLPDMTDQRWVQRTHRAFGEEPDAEVFGYSIQVEQERDRQAPQQQRDNQGDSSTEPRSDRPAQEPTTPSSRDADRGDRTPAREPSTPSSDDMQSR